MKTHPFLNQQQINSLIIFRNKATCGHDNCKKKAAKASQVISSLLTQGEKMIIIAARDRALADNEAKEDFDKVMKQLFDRLKLDQKGKFCETPT